MRTRTIVVGLSVWLCIGCVGKIDPGGARSLQGPVMPGDQDDEDASQPGDGDGGVGAGDGDGDLSEDGGLVVNPPKPGELAVTPPSVTIMTNTTQSFSCNMPPCTWTIKEGANGGTVT